MNIEALKKIRSESVSKLKNELVDFVLIIIGLFSLPALFISLLRIGELGILPIMYAHTLIVSTLVLIVLFRKRLVYAVRSATVILLLLSIGTLGLMNFGLSGNGSLFLLSCVLFGSLLFGKRLGAILLVLCLSIICLVWYNIDSLLPQKVADFNNYNYATSSWLTMLISFLMLAFTLFKILAKFNQFFYEMVDKLEDTVAIRTEEISQRTEELIAANLAKSQFLANMSHEIRTPMNGVLGMLGLLKNTPLTDNQRNKLNLANSSAKSLLALINDILDFSKIEAGKIELRHTEFNLRALLDEIAQAMALQAQDKGLELILDHTFVEQSLFFGDPHRLRQILINLIGNAIKFTESGQVYIRAKTVFAGELGVIFLCDVEDSGMGIPENKISQLFEKFSQVDSSSTKENGGTGLGLSISRKLCELMGGGITIASEEGKGSCFSFTVMLEISESAQLVLPKVDITKLNILIVDDNDINREVLRGQLEHWGAVVSEVSSGTQALEVCENYLKINHKPFEAGFLDMQMPKMDGAELARRFRQNPQLNAMKLIMMTSITQQNDAQYFADIGFNGYFTKPTSTEDLLDALMVVVDDGEVLSKANQIVTHDFLQTLDRTAGSIVESLTDSMLENSAINKFAPNNNFHILIVEDNQINQQVALGMLEEWQLKSDLASNGKEAIKKITDATNNYYDLILMDCHMPVMDGYETTRQIRLGNAGQSAKDIIIIAMTANALDGDREKCLATGMNDYLPKPIEPESLLKLLSLWLLEKKFKDNQTKISEKETGYESTNENIEQTNIHIWDSSALLRRVMGKEKLMKVLIVSFLKETPERIKKLLAAYQQQNIPELTGISHTIKGVSANLSGLILQKYSAELEMATKNNDLASIDLLVSEVVNAHEQLVQTLNSYLQSSAE